MITKEQALALKPGDMIYSHSEELRGYKRWEVKSKARLWKDHPERFRISIKLVNTNPRQVTHAYYVLTNWNSTYFYLAEA